MIINRVRPLSIGKMAGFLYALIGLFVGAIFAVFALLAGAAGATGAAANDAEGPAAALGANFGVAGVAAIDVRPIYYGLMGFIGAIIMAAIYNLVARMVGGIEVDVS
jgi:hypothetical protein